MNRRQLLLTAAAAAVAPALPAEARSRDGRGRFVDSEPPYLGDMMYRADLSDGRRLTTYGGLQSLLESHMDLAQGRTVEIITRYNERQTRFDPFIVRIERYNRDTMAWEFYAGRRG